MQISSETRLTTFDAGDNRYCTMRSHCKGDAEW